MARTKRIERTIQKNIAIPEDLVARMELELFSDVQGRIPFGAQQELIVRLLRNHFAAIDRAYKREKLMGEMEVNILSGEPMGKPVYTYGKKEEDYD